MTPRERHTSTVARRTPSLSASSGMPTGSQLVMKQTVAKLLTDDQNCSDTHYMTKTQQALAQQGRSDAYKDARYDTWNPRKQSASYLNAYKQAARDAALGKAQS